VAPHQAPLRQPIQNKRLDSQLLADLLCHSDQLTAIQAHHTEEHQEHRRSAGDGDPLQGDTKLYPEPSEESDQKLDQHGQDDAHVDHQQEQENKGCNQFQQLRAEPIAPSSTFQRRKVLGESSSINHHDSGNDNKRRVPSKT
jgi:hypothetical protein